MKEDEQEPKVTAQAVPSAAGTTPESLSRENGPCAGYKRQPGTPMAQAREAATLRWKGSREGGGRVGCSGHLKPTAALGAMTIPRCMSFRSEMN